MTSNLAVAAAVRKQCRATQRFRWPDSICKLLLNTVAEAKTERWQCSVQTGIKLTTTGTSEQTVPVDSLSSQFSTFRLSGFVLEVPSSDMEHQLSVDQSTHKVGKYTCSAWNLDSCTMSHNLKLDAKKTADLERKSNVDELEERKFESLKVFQLTISLSRFAGSIWGIWNRV